MKSKVESRVVKGNPMRVPREKGESGKRLWTRELANAFMGRVANSGAVKGLTYWSAYDFLNGSKAR